MKKDAVMDAKQRPGFQTRNRGIGFTRSKRSRSYGSANFCSRAEAEESCGQIGKSRPSSDWRRRPNKPRRKIRRNENPLHQCQIESGVGLIVSKSIPNKHAKRETRAFANKSHKRCLSIADHSCSDPLRNATTTPAN